MLPIEQARIRLRKLRVVAGDTRRKLGDKEVWNWRDKGARFRAVKFADPPEAQIGDYTGIRVRISGRLKATKEVASDLAKALGEPTRKKVTIVLHKPKELIWKNPKFG